MNLRNVLALCGLFLYFGHSTSDSIIMDDYGYCGYSEAEEDLCASYCFKSVKPPLTYIMELKEQMKGTAQAIRDKDKQLEEFGKRLLEMNEWKDQFMANNQQIDNLRKTNNILMESLQRQNQIANIEELVNNTINNQKAEIEHLKMKVANNKERNSTKLKQIEENLIESESSSKISESLRKTNEDLAKTNEDLRKTIEILKKSAELNTNEITNQKAEIEDLKLKVAKGEDNSLKLEQVERNPIVNKKRISRDSCKGRPSGTHFISISGLVPFPARCNADINGGGWLVIHRLLEDRTVFHRNWTDFRKGFGRLGADFFIGLKLLHRITNSGTYELYVQVEYPKGNFEFASYENFKIGNEDSKYRLESLGKSKGALVDRLNLNLYQNFSTFDQDNDNDLRHCAQYYDGAWWYNKCDKPVFNFGYYSIFNSHLTAISSQPFQMLIRPTSKV